MLRIYALLIFLWACGEDTTKNQMPIAEENPGTAASETPTATRPQFDNGSDGSKENDRFKPFPKHFSLMKSARATAYYPSNSPMEGGYKDRFGNPLRTLQDFLEGKASYVSVAMDKNLNLPNGQIVRIPEIDNHFKRQIIFKVVDTGGAFTGKGYSRIDICVRSYANSTERVVNQNVTLIFP